MVVSEIAARLARLYSNKVMNLMDTWVLECPSLRNADTAHVAD